jgi:hypothetical protein
VDGAEVAETRRGYAILAYLLNLAEVVPADFELSDENIREVQERMPNRNGMTTDHGMWPGASQAKGGIGNGGTPDVKNVACMKDCKKEVVIASALPDYAQDAHGNLAEQNRRGPDARQADRRTRRRQRRRRQGRCSGCARGWGRGCRPRARQRQGLHGLPWRGQQDRRPRVQ